MNIINRTTHDVQQGTDPWMRLRESVDGTASEAPAALGVGKYTTRTELLRRKHTGIAEEHDAATIGRFAAGHAAEAKARPLAEDIAGDLYPVTMSAQVDGLRLLSSLDGLTMDETIAWETKLWNEELAANVRAGTLPAHYTVQMDQELLVSGASRCLFTCTDGTPERFVSCWYEADEAKFEALIAGWRQFSADLATYEPPAATEPAPVGRAPENLPALNIEVTGMVTRSNLAEFKQTALSAIQLVNRNLKTDQDFADAAKSVKWCEDIESRIKAAKEHALSQTSSIEELFRTLDAIAAESKTVRLDLSKVVDKRKTEVKEEAVAAARAALDKHIADLNGELAPMRLQAAPAEFAGAIRGLRSIASMQDALDTMLAGAKIAADTQARAIRANLTTYNAEANGLDFLFADLGAVVHKAADDFRALVLNRVTTHKAAEAAREALAAERAAAALQVAAAPAPVSPIAAPAPAASSPPVPEVSPVARAVSPVAADELATLVLGAICERLGFTISAAFVADMLRINPAGQSPRKTPLYTERQFGMICRQLASHASAMAEQYAGEPA